jgi:pimeloyl-ACP methyl ester carboxylesterase
VPTPRLRWHRTTLRGQVAHFGDIGEGPPLVFVHGWGLSIRAYAKALPELARAGVRVIAPALPGFGRSAPLTGTYTFEKLALWLDELLDQAGVDEPAFLVGHSFGGGVATATAYHHPERARSLVLVNAVGGAVWKRDAENEHSLADRPLWDWGRHFPLELRARRIHKVAPVIMRDFVENAIRNPKALRLAANLARTADLRGELATLAARGLPVTVLWGDQDKVIPQATFASICEAAGTEGDIVSDAGHAWLLADPAGFGELMTNSLTIHALMSRQRRIADQQRSEASGPAA